MVTATTPINAIVNNSVYQTHPQPQIQTQHLQQQHHHQHQHQPQPTIIAQNSLPKIGAIKATTLGANAQQKVLNIVKSQKASPLPLIANAATGAVVVTAAALTATTPTIQTINTVQHIKAANHVQQLQLQQHQQQHQQHHQQHHPLVQNGTTNIITTSDNIINTTTPIAANRQFINTNSRNTVAAAPMATAIHREVTVKSESLATSTNTSNTTTSNGSKAANNRSNANALKPTSNPNNAPIKREVIEHTAPIIAAAQVTPPTRTNAPAATGIAKDTAPTPTPAPAAPTNRPSVPTVQPAEQIEQKMETVEDENEPEPEIDIVINNVVCSFSVRCHLNLREIALNGRNVEFRRENGMVTMKLRRPYTTASIWSSGRITCTGATSEDQVWFIFHFLQRHQSVKY